MTALSFQSKGRLRAILQKWQGQQVSLIATSDQLLITPEYLEYSLSNSDGFQCSNSFTQILKRRHNMENLPVYQHYSEKKNKNKKKNHTYHDQNDFVYRASEVKQKKKTRLFSELAQQYKNRQQRKSAKRKRNHCFIAEDYGQYIKTEEEVLESISEESLDDKVYEPEEILSQISVFNQEIMKKIRRQRSEDFSQIMDEIKVATDKIIENRSKKKQQKMDYPGESEFSNSNEQIFSFEGRLNNSPQTQDQYQVLLNAFEMKESEYHMQSEDHMENNIENLEEKKSQQNNSQINNVKEQEKKEEKVVKTYKIELIERRVKEANVIRLSPIRIRPKQQQTNQI